MLVKPDPTFHPSPRMAMQAPRERHAYVALLDPAGDARFDGLATVDLDPASPTYGQIVHTVDMPERGDELHHFGWNVCSAALCPYAPHPHLERRYLVVPGLRSSRICVLDTKPDPRRPEIVKIVEADEVTARTGYSRPHTVHCGPDGIYVSALGAPDGNAPGGIFVLDHDTFEPLGRWEVDRGPQRLHYDFWWHLGHDVMLTSEWGTPNMIEGGPGPRAAPRSRVRPPAPRLGPAPAAPPAGARARRRAPDRPRAAPCPRPHPHVRVRQHRHQRRGPDDLGVHLASTQRRLAGVQDGLGPPRAGCGRRPAAGAAAVRSRAAAVD